MNIRRTLCAFDVDTRVRYYIGNSLIENIRTVGEFLTNGLTAYIQAEIGALSIEDDAIVIRC